MGKPINGTEPVLGIDRMALAGDPVHPLRPHRDAALFAGGALEQRQIEVAAFEVALQIDALIGADVEPQGRDASAKTSPAISPADRRRNPRARRAAPRLHCPGAPARRGLLPPAPTAAAHRTTAARRPRSASRPCRCDSSSGWPISSSSRLICWLTVDWVRWTRSPARVKPPASTTETKLRNSSRSSMTSPVHSIYSFSTGYSLTFNFQIARGGPISAQGEFPRKNSRKNSRKFHVACPIRRGSPRQLQSAAAL